MNHEIAMDATDLTQLSSREQLSALMDGALPADETRFLLRRLQHDGSLAECWERWRLSAEVMRGLAPAQRLPSDFASRVAASLRSEEAGKYQRGEASVETSAADTKTIRTPAWLRWSGGAAVAASLAVIAFMTQPAAVESPGNMPDNTVVAVADTGHSLANDSFAPSKAPAPQAPEPQSPEQYPNGAGLETQTAALASVVAVAAARTNRDNRVGGQARATQAVSLLTAANEGQTGSAGFGIAAGDDIPPLLPQADIITRPWPRSVLPHAGSAGFTVGFGDSSRNTVPSNPFLARTGIDNLPPALIVDAPAGNAATPANDDSDPAAIEPRSRRSQP